MSLTQLLAFLNSLEDREIYYTLIHDTADAVMVDVALPDIRFEIEFYEDGRIEVEQFESEGVIEERTPEDLLANFDRILNESATEQALLAETSTNDEEAPGAER